VKVLGNTDHSQPILSGSDAKARCAAAWSALFRELCERPASGSSPAPLSGGATASLGAAFAQCSTATELAHAVLSLGRTEDASRARGREAGRAQQSALEEAVVQALHAYENARHQRRQAWLAYLTHELKNPLNTILNALWLLREKGEDKVQARRFLELAERGARRIEVLVREVRQLDEKMALVPPINPGADNK
jgi:signal transduction histidine kinase